MAREFNISRVDQDKFSLRSQEKALKAIEAGALSAARVLAQSTERYAIASMCIGVGQGSAILLERV